MKTRFSPSDVALVTGASQGIGKRIAECLHECGVPVGLVSRRQHELESVATSLGERALAIGADLRDEAQLDSAVTVASEAFGPISILVNNAGVCQPKPLRATSSKDLLDSWEVNVRAPLLLTKHVEAGMRENGGGSIVNISSALASVAVPNRADYASTKGALEAATRALAVELGDGGIRVNAVAPSLTMSPMTQEALSNPVFRTSYLKGVPLNRIATPDDIADVVVFLASAESSYITGQCLVVDGGWSSTRPPIRPGPDAH